jgi:hypothetical protein
MPLTVAMAYTPFSQRHHYLQPKMKHVPKTSILQDEQCRRGLAGAAKKAEIWEDIQDIWDYQNEKAVELALKYKKSVAWMKACITRHPFTHYGQTQRKPNL